MNSLNTKEWRIIDHPGYAGTGKTGRDAARNRLYGQGNWRTAFRWGDGLVDRGTALQLYDFQNFSQFFSSGGGASQSGYSVNSEEYRNFICRRGTRPLHIIYTELEKICRTGERGA